MVDVPTTRIGDLNPAELLNENYELPADYDGFTYRVKVLQLANLIKALIVGGAPEDLNTLQELAAALSNDASFATTVNAALAAALLKDGSRKMTGNLDLDGNNILNAANLAAYLKADGSTPATGSLNMGGYSITNVGNISGPPAVIIEDQKATGTDGGDSVVGLQVRDLNTLVRNAGSLASLASNRFTLPAGTYYVKITMCYAGGQGNRAMLWNYTDSTWAIFGTSDYSSNLYQYGGVSFAESVITISGSKEFQLQQYASVARATYGRGSAVGLSPIPEIYSRVMIWKV